MRLLDLFIASSVPVIKVLLVTGLGSYIALERVNILGQDARHHLNNIVFYVFGPALVGSNLAKKITYESMLTMWFMPVNILITFIVGSFLGWLVTKVAKPPAHLRGLIIGCCAAGNLGNLLLIIIPAVCKERGSPFGSHDVCVGNGMAYASLSMAVSLFNVDSIYIFIIWLILFFLCIYQMGAIYIWSYVYNIVRVSSTKSVKEIETSESPTSMSSREGALFPSEITLTEPLLDSDGLTGAADTENGVIIPHNKPENSQVSVSERIKKTLEKLFKNMNLKRVLAPSTIGAIVGFVVGLVPPIQKLLIGEAAPLHVFQDTAVLIGEGAIPAITLIMGGNLLKGLKGGSELPKSLIFGIIMVRYIALPLIGIGVVKGALGLGLINDDPLYKFVLLLQFTLPPAMNIGTITQLFGVGETECSVIMLWCYSLASVALTCWSTFFLWLVS